MPCKLALIGNPNCGKTTLFNLLTGSNQYVGNWAGVTVEKKTGILKGTKHEIVDLPGIYALSPYSAEERITQEFLLKQNPDVIINIIDGTNFERNMYLTIQLIELNKPMVVAVNMMDDVRACGGKIDCEYLSKLIGVPFIPISARKSENTDRVIQEIHHVLNSHQKPNGIKYNLTTSNALNSIYSVIADGNNDNNKAYSYYSAKLLEGDSHVFEYINPDNFQRAKIEQIAKDYERRSAYPDREALVADARYKYIQKLAKKAVTKPVFSEKPTISDKIDSIVTNRFLAFPIFSLIMLLMFMLTFGSVGSFFSGIIEKFFSAILSDGTRSFLISISAPEWTIRLLADGIIKGVGGVLVFLPQIAILFLVLTLLEDSGYMARAAFLTDRFLRKFGLSGRSFIPMLMGFGCTTPAVMAARTQENISERRMTIMLIPFMSCGAKIPIYALFAETFFGKYKGLAVFSMYLVGMIMAVLMGWILSKTLFKETKAAFIMELPPYRCPMLKSVVKNTWEKTKGFIIKAGTVIFAMSIVIWFLQNFTPLLKMTVNSSESIFAEIGNIAAPFLEPLGFGTWQSAAALLSGVVAKEAVVSTMSVLYSAGTSAALTDVISKIFTPLSAYSFMVFCLLYMPCISAFATIKHEMNSWKWALTTALIQLITAYIASMLIYQIGSFII